MRRATVRVSCAQALLHVEASRDPSRSGDTARKADRVSFGSLCANIALLGSTAFLVFLSMAVSNHYAQSSQKLCAYRKLLVKIVLVWVAIADEFSLVLGEHARLSRSQNPGMKGRHSNFLYRRTSKVQTLAPRLESAERSFVVLVREAVFCRCCRNFWDVIFHTSTFEDSNGIVVDGVADGSFLGIAQYLKALIAYSKKSSANLIQVGEVEGTNFRTAGFCEHCLISTLDFQSSSARRSLVAVGNKDFFGEDQGCKSS